MNDSVVDRGKLIWSCQNRNFMRARGFKRENTPVRAVREKWGFWSLFRWFRDWFRAFENPLGDPDKFENFRKFWALWRVTFEVI